MSQSAPGPDLFLDLGRVTAGGAPARLRIRIEDGLREAIRSGRLPRGTRLPATRQLARDLGVSRGTVLQAYDQLSAEGWIQGHQGAATLVVAEAEEPLGASAHSEHQRVRWRFDLRPGRPDPTSFPRSTWLRAARRALSVAPSSAFGVGDPAGLFELRSELAGYLNRARGLRAAPAELVVTGGFVQGLALVTRSLGADPGRVAMEEPSMRLHRAIVRAAGRDLLLVSVDREGMVVEELEQHQDVRLVVLTPHRQHPTGATLSARRRSRLLSWARETGAVILEDDYDGEFRYDRHPLGALQSLDPQSVVYAGTLSKTLTPALRLGWLVVPERLRDALRRQKALTDWQSPALDQLTFAEMLRSGAYDRHVRRMRLAYRQRRDHLVRALREARRDLTVVGADAGLNILVPLPDADTERQVLSAAWAAGIGVDGLASGGYFERPGPAGIIVGYGAATPASFDRAVEALVSVLCQLPARRSVRASERRGADVAIDMSEAILAAPTHEAVLEERDR